MPVNFLKKCYYFGREHSIDDLSALGNFGFCHAFIVMWAFSALCVHAPKVRWARGYFVASSGNVTDEIIKEYIKNQDLQERSNSDSFGIG